MIPAVRVIDLNEITLIPSERGQPQLVIRNKIFQKKTEKRTMEGVVISRNWSCKDLTCKVRATSTHHVGSNSACDIASFSGVELKGDNPHTCHYNSQGNEQSRKARNEIRRVSYISEENEGTRLALNENRRNSYIAEENEQSRKARNDNRRNDYLSRVQQYTNQIEREKEILHNCLAQAASGQVPDIPLEMCGSVNRGASSFINQQFTNTLYECVLCKEKWWPNLKLPTTPYTCSQCNKDIKTLEIPRFSHLNDMNPVYPHNADATKLQEFENEYYSLLQECPLSAIEEALIARRTVVMQAYRLKGGQQGFSGNVISFPQRTSDLAQYLPRMASSIKWITVRCKRAADPSEYKDFKVHRSYIRRWLLFLVKWSPAYSDVEISETNINLLPENESIYSHLESLGDINDGNQTMQENSDSDDDGEDGAADGPQEAGNIEVLESGVASEADQQNELCNLVTAIRDGEDAHIDWPERETIPVNEHTDSLLLASAFPTLFPCGSGDVTCNLNRKERVTFNEAITHYIKFYDSKRKCYPFAKNSRFLHFIQDVDERHRIQSQASVYMQKNPEDANLSVGDLRGMIRSNADPSAYIIQKKMQRFAANISGSAAYMHTRKKELTALMEQEGPGTLWFTLTMPNWMWKDLHHIFGDVPTQNEGEDSVAYEKRCEKDARKKYFANPHIVNEFFIRRCESFVGFFFGPECFESVWTWYRFEWQKRGNIHVHGMAKLKCDPGFTNLSKKVIDGRKALKVLEIISQSDLIENIRDVEALEVLDSLKDTYSSHEGDDIRVEPIMIEKISHMREIEYQFVQGLQNIYYQGEEAARKIITFRDYTMTNMNPSQPLPTDATSEEREAPADKTSEPHPCSTCHTSFAGGTFLLFGPDHEVKYAKLVDWCQRHRHNQSYCMREKNGSYSCRFNLPNPVINNTKVVVVDILYKKGDKENQIRKTCVKLVFSTNDGWVNSHSTVGLSTWGANMDIALLVDYDAVIEYVAKYCNKVETPSAAFKDVVKKSIQMQQENSISNTKGILRKAFNRIAGRRDKCVMEVAHLILSSPYVVCSHAFQLVNLTSSTRRVNLEGGTEESATKKNLVDLYAGRMTLENWKHPLIYAMVAIQLEYISLQKFVISFKLSSSKIQKRTNEGKPIVAVFSPDFKSNPESPDYWRYAYISLLKYKPWLGFKESVFGGIEGSASELSQTSHTVQQLIITAFNVHFRDNISNPSTYMTDHVVQRRIDTVISEGEVELNSPTSQFSIDETFAFDNFMRRAINDSVLDEEENEQSTWNSEFDFTKPQHEYPNGELEPEKIIKKWAEISSTQVSEERPQVYLTSFDKTDEGSRQQAEVVEVFLKICGLHKNSIGQFEEPQKNGGWDRKGGNVVLVPGPAGAGKSYLVDCLVTEAVQRYKEKTGHDGYVLIVAPTGRAAVQAGGYTLQSSQGLSVPVDDQTKYAKNHYKQGNALMKLQQRINYLGNFSENNKHLIGVVVDEYSMISSTQFFWMDDRLRQATLNSDFPFGDVPIIIFGDPGQLPPVGGSSLWLSKTQSNRALSDIAQAGHKLYMNIKTVMWLTKVRRQSGEFMEFLLRLRDGKCTDDDWTLINANCSIERMNFRRKQEFQSPETMSLFSTNLACDKKNATQISNLNNPICCVEANHDLPIFKNKSSEACRKLQSKFYLSLGSKVMLLWNTNTPLGLVNGSTGTVIDFVFREGQKAPQLPFAIICEFQDYKGPPFFNGEERSKWVPLRPEKYEFTDSKGKNHFRQQYPLCLAWALTIWKAQGLTIRGKVVLELDDIEKTTAQSYVAMSRATIIENMCIGKALSRDRLTTEISKSKVLQNRLKEDERLTHLWRSTREFYGL